MYSKEERVDMEMNIQVVDDDDALHAELVHMVMSGDDNDDDGVQNPSTDFDAMGTTTITEGEVWQLDESEHQGNFLDVNDSASNMFYDDQFPVLPDFSCMSSSSSTPSTPAAPTNPVPTPSASSASTSSSATSWAVLKSDGEEDVENKEKVAPTASGATLSSTLSMEGLTPSDGGGTIDCMDMMEDFGYLDLLDSNEIWDPSSIFDQTPQELLQLDDHQSKQDHDEQVPLDHYFIHQEGRNGNRNNDLVQNEEKPLDDMGLMFFEWLKSNKDSISAEDMRKIKLRTSTIECATKRLGSSKEGQKKLVKLILDWVAKCQLRKKREEAAAAAAAANQYPYTCQEPPPPPPQIFPNPNPNPNYNFGPPGPPADPSSCFPPPPWIPPALPAMQPYMAAPVAAPPPSMTYMGGADHPFNNFANPYNNCEYQMLDSSQPWNQSQITMGASQFNNLYPDHMANNNLMGPGYVTEQYPYPPQMYNGNNGDQIVLRSGASATKEARKKRMARQRRFSWNHHPRHHHHHHQQPENHQNPANFDNCSNKNMGNWGYWAPPVAARGAAPIQMMAVPPPPPPSRPPRDKQVDGLVMQEQNGPKQNPPAEKKQGWKSEKNLKFLLQKVLKQSDVGNLGRIVLPKKEAETHLPELESRDGISISMEDIGTSKVWNMRYRFWPNNKSRMYLLENTGDFVKANELQEGDFIVLYSDMKCGKYLIRGVKVRELGTKPEPAKKGGKRNQRNGTSTSPSKKHQKAEKAKGMEQEKEGGEMCSK